MALQLLPPEYTYIDGVLHIRLSCPEELCGVDGLAGLSGCVECLQSKRTVQWGLALGGGEHGVRACSLQRHWLWPQILNMAL